MLMDFMNHILRMKVNAPNCGLCMNVCSYNHEDLSLKDISYK